MAIAGGSEEQSSDALGVLLGELAQALSRLTSGASVSRVSG